MPLEVDNWLTTADSNILVSGTDIDEGMLPQFINNALRRIMAAMRAWRDVSYCKDKNVTIQATGGSPPASPQENDWFIEYTP